MSLALAGRRTVTRKVLNISTHVVLTTTTSTCETSLQALGGYEEEMLTSNISECFENLCIQSLNLTVNQRLQATNAKLKRAQRSQLRDGVNEAQ